MKSLVAFVFALAMVALVANGIAAATTPPPPISDCEGNCPNVSLCDGTPATRQCYVYCPNQKTITCQVYFNYGCHDCPQ